MNLNDADQWLDFTVKLNTAFPTFLDKLHKKHPDLKPREVKVCALLFLDSSSKEIALKLEMDPHAVDAMRSRLREKFLVFKDNGLGEYLRKDL